MNNVSSMTNAEVDVRISDDDEIKRLAGLSVPAYERERVAAAEKLGMRTSALDRLVRDMRRTSGAEKGQGQVFTISDPNPSPEKVDGAELLNDIAALIRRHVVLSPEQADGIALYVLHTHAFDAAQIAPRLIIKSPEKRCGKTTLLSTLSHLVRRPLATSGISPAALFRIIDDSRPALLIDEADTFVASNDDIRRVINSGHTPELAHVTITVGDDHEPRRFSTWSPMVIAGIGKLPGTIEDRGISINLRRRRREETIDRLRFHRVDHLNVAASKAFRWAEDHIVELAALDAEPPESLHDRAADNWHPLLGIAACVGGEWPARARRAALKLSAEGALDQDSLGTLLLADIRGIFGEADVDRLSCDGLLDRLLKLEDRPWPESNRGRPLTKTGLGRMLGKFGIFSSGVISPDRKAGYLLSAFADPFERYALAEKGPQSLEVSQPANDGHFSHFQSLEEKPLRDFENNKKPNNDGPCETSRLSEGGMSENAHAGGQLPWLTPAVEEITDTSEGQAILRANGSGQGVCLKCGCAQPTAELRLYPDPADKTLRRKIKLHTGCHSYWKRDPRPHPSLVPRTNGAEAST
jgi:putative DNA primase/helicase